MNVLFVTSEVVPFAKTGGLADVSGAMPIAMRRKGVDVRVIMPLYRQIDRAKYNISQVADRVAVPGFNEYASIFKSVYQGTTFYFVGNERYYDRDHLYTTPEGDYEDNADRFIFFCRSILESCKSLNFRPDIIHCNDWQSALIPLYLKKLYSEDPFFSGTASVLSVHNVVYQGVFQQDVFSKTGFDRTDSIFEMMEYYGKVNFMKAGLLSSDIVTTVSERYSEEIQTSSEFGAGLERIFASRKRDLVGILNGLDYETWDPKNDRYIDSNYSIKNLAGKSRCKKGLLNEVGLPYAAEIPLLGIVTRLDAQKGLDILSSAIDEILSMDVQFILLGTGRQDFHQIFEDIGKRYPKKTSIHIKFDERLAHRIYAASNFFLMPSRYEPCGLGQMISMTYGTCPIVHTTGGLADTVVHFSPERGEGNGFRFDNYTAKDLVECVKEAIGLFQKPSRFKRLIHNMMNTDFSWKRSIEKYIDVYKKALKLIN